MAKQMTKILIIEDDSETKKIIKNYLLRTLNCEVQEAGEGKEALTKIKGNNFDLVILDIGLPGINGTDILKKIKEKKLNLDFLVTSGWDSLSVLEKTLDYGAKDYLSKPFSLDMFGLKVKEILTKKNKYFPKQ